MSTVETGLRTYTNGQAYTLGRLDFMLSRRHNLQSLQAVGILEKRVFLHNQDNPKAEKEQRFPITPRLMYALERSIWGYEAQAIEMGLQREVVELVEKHTPRLRGSDGGDTAG